TYSIALKNANVEDVYNVIRDLYADRMDQNPRFGIAAAFGQNNRNSDPYGNPRAVQLSLAADLHTNTLHMSCPESLYKDIEVVVKRMEEAAGGSTGTVRIVRSQGVDPRQVQQAIDAIMGRPTNTQQNNGFGGFGPFGNNMGGFNRGGGFPG